MTRRNLSSKIYRVDWTDTSVLPDYEPIELRFREETFDVSGWRDLYVHIVKAASEQGIDPAAFSWLSLVSKKQARSFQRPEQFDRNRYFESGVKRKECIRRIAAVVAEFSDEPTVYVRKIVDEEGEETPNEKSADSPESSPLRKRAEGLMRFFKPEEYEKKVGKEKVDEMKDGEKEEELFAFDWNNPPDLDGVRPIEALLGENVKRLETWQDLFLFFCNGCLWRRPERMRLAVDSSQFGSFLSSTPQTDEHVGLIAKVYVKPPKEAKSVVAEIKRLAIFCGLSLDELLVSCESIEKEERGDEIDDSTEVSAPRDAMDDLAFPVFGASETTNQSSEETPVDEEVPDPEATSDDSKEERNLEPRRLDWNNFGDLTYTTPVDVRFWGEKINPANWRDLYAIVAKRLFSLHPTAFYRVRRRDMLPGGDCDAFRAPVEISDGLYIEGNLSAHDTTKRLREMLELCGEPVDALSIGLARSKQSVKQPRIPVPPFFNDEETTNDEPALNDDISDETPPMQSSDGAFYVDWNQRYQFNALRPIEASFLGETTKFQRGSWRQVYAFVAKKCRERDPALFNLNGPSVYTAQELYGLRKYDFIPFADGLYLRVNNTVEELVEKIDKLLNKCGFSLDDLKVLCVSSGTGSVVPSDEGPDAVEIEELPIIEQDDSFTVDIGACHDFTKIRPVKASFLGETIVPARYVWRNVYAFVVRKLREKYPVEFPTAGPRLFRDARKSTNSHLYASIGDGLFINVNLRIVEVVEKIRKVLKRFGRSLNDLEVVGVGDKVATTRREPRRVRLRKPKRTEEDFADLPSLDQDGLFSVDVGDSYDFAKMRPVEATFMGETWTPIRFGWRDLYGFVAKICYELEPDALKSLGMLYRINDEEVDLNVYAKIDESLYIYKNCRIDHLIERMRALISAVGLKSEDLTLMCSNYRGERRGRPSGTPGRERRSHSPRNSRVRGVSGEVLEVDWNDVEDFWQTRPVEMSLFGENRSYKKWVYLMEDVLTAMYERHPDAFTRDDFPITVVRNEDALVKTLRLDDDVYAQRLYNTPAMLNKIRQLFDYCGESLDNITVRYVRRDNSSPVSGPVDLFPSRVKEFVSLVLKEDCVNGLRMDSRIARNEFLDFYKERTGENFPEDIDLENLCLSIGYELNGRIYALDSGTRSTIEGIVNHVFKTSNNVASYNVVFEKHYDVLSKIGISSVDWFKQVLKAVFPYFCYKKRFFCKWTQGNTFANEIISAFHEQGATFMTREEICRYRPYLDKDVIQQVCISCHKFVAQQNTFALLEELIFDERDIDNTRRFFENQIETKSFVLITKAVVDHSVEFYPSLPVKALQVGLYEQNLSNEFSRYDDVITRKGDSYDPWKTFQAYCCNLSSSTLRELETVAKELTGRDDPNRVLDEASEVLLRVDKEEFSSFDSIKFDVERIDDEIAFFVGNGISSIKSISDFILFPSIAPYSWNGYLLDSYCRHFSRRYRSIGGFKRKKITGVVYSTDRYTFKTEDDALAEVLASSEVVLEIGQASDLLINEGYIGSKRNIEHILEQAVKIRRRRC